MKTNLTHDHLSQMIPWYVNGTLSAEEQALVGKHLKTCASCQEEIRQLTNVSAAMKDLNDDVPNIAPSFARVWATIEKSESPKPAARRWSAAHWFSAFWNPTIPVARLVFAGQLALIVGLGIYSYRLGERTPAYTVLSGPEQNTGGARVTINFAPNTTVEQMNQILQGVDGRIVSGPGATGIYVVELSVRPESDADVQAIINKLRTSSAIRFVEREP